MKKARIFLTVIVVCVLANGLLAYKVNQRNLNNLYRTTTAIFTLSGATMLLSYATLAPYRTFPTDITQLSVSPPFPLYANITFTTTTIGGNPFTYTVTTGFAWNLPIYADEDQ